MEYLNSISQHGVATPYLALFDENGIPIYNPITGIPIGAYISKFSFKYDEEKENQASINFDTGNPDFVDIDELKDNQYLLLQWGYIYPDGSSVSGPLKRIKIKDFNCLFDTTGTHVTIKCVDELVELRHLPPHRPSAEDDDNDGISSMVDYMNRGCDHSIGIIIEKFSYR